MVFIMMIYAMLITLNFGGVAEKLLENKDAVKQYLLQQNWTSDDMTAHSWFKNDVFDWNCWGKNDGNNFIKGKGI